MNHSNYWISLDINKIYSQLTLTLKHGETGRLIHVRLTEDGRPYQISEGCSATLQALKTDSINPLSYSCTVQDNMITFYVEPSLTSVVGRVECEIVLRSKDDQTILSSSFGIAVFNNVFSQIEEENAADKNTLSQVIADGNALIKDLESKRDNGDFNAGFAPEMNVITKTGETGTEASVKVTTDKSTPNTAKKFDFEFTIPKGEKGEQGIQGETGAKLVSQELIGQDENGGNIYRQIYDDGTTVEFIAPRGEQGVQGEKGAAGAIKFLSVVSLPTENIEEDAIYLVPIEDSTEENRFTEYVYVNGKWETLGAISVQVDHSEYVKFTDFASNDKAGVIKVSTSLAYGLEILISPSNPKAHGCLTIKPPTDAKIKNRAVNSLSREAVTLQWADKVVKAVLTDPQVTMTAEEQAKACDWLGAVKKITDKTATEQIYAKTADGETYMRGVAYAPQGGQIPIYGGMATTGLNNPPPATLPFPIPTQPYQGVPKKYVDNLPDNLTLTNDQQLAWQLWLGIDKPLEEKWYENISVDPYGIPTFVSATDITSMLFNKLKVVSGTYVVDGGDSYVEYEAVEEIVDIIRTTNGFKANITYKNPNDNSTYVESLNVTVAYFTEEEVSAFGDSAGTYIYGSEGGFQNLTISLSAIGFTK